MGNFLGWQKKKRRMLPERGFWQVTKKPWAPENKTQKSEIDPPNRPEPNYAISILIEDGPKTKQND